MKHRTEKLESEFLTAAISYGRLDIRLQFQKHPIIDLKVRLRSLGVSLFLHLLFGAKQVLTHNSRHERPVTKPARNVSNWYLVS